MSVTDLGKVGFGVDTSGPKSLADSLDQTTASAQKLNTTLDQTASSSVAAATGVKALSSEADNTAANVGRAASAIRNMGTSVDFSKMTAGIANAETEITKLGGATQSTGQMMASAIESSIGRSTVSFDSMRTGIAAANGALAESGAAAKANTGIFSSLASMLGLASGSMTTHETATRGTAAAHEALGVTTLEVRESMHVLAPELEALGMQMQGLTQFSYASRAGFIGLGVAIAGTVVVDLAKADDIIQTTSTRLQGLAGVKMGTQLHDGLVSMAGDIGKVAYGLAPAIESVTKLGQELAASNQSLIFVGGLEGIKAKAGDVTTALGALWEQLRMGGASETEATAGVNAFFASVQKAGGVTGDMFRQLATVAPQAAQDIARGLTNNFSNGISSVTALEASLDKVPLSLNGILTVLGRMAAGTKDAFAAWKEDPKTVAESVTSLKNSFEELWKSASGGNDFKTTVIGTTKSLSDGLRQMKQAADDSKKSGADWSGGWIGYLKTADDEGSKSMGELVTYIKTFNSDGSEQLRQFNEAVIQYLNLRPLFADLKSVYGQGNADIASFAATAIESFSSIAQAALSTAKTVASAIAGMAAGGGGGNPSSAGGGNPGTTDALGNVSPGSSGGAADTSISSSGGGASAPGDAVASTPTDTGSSAPAGNLSYCRRTFVECVR